MTMKQITGTFYWYGSYKTKGEATAVANKLRKSPLGYSVMVRKKASGQFYTYWNVYTLPRAT